MKRIITSTHHCLCTDGITLMCDLVALATYGVVAVDFVRGFLVDWPTPVFPRIHHHAAPKVHPPHTHAMSLTLVRLLMMTFPLSIRIAGFFINTKTINIPYTDKKTNNRLMLDVVVARKTKKGEQRPVLLYVHGGAWLYGSKEVGGLVPVHFIAAEGWIVVTINYRLSKIDGSGAVWPDHIVDVKSAIVWVKENIAQFGGDPSVIVIAGGSAGGHLASLAAVSPNAPQFQPGFEDKDTAVQGCIDLYGVTDFADQHDQWKAHDGYHGKRHKDPEHYSLFTHFLHKSIMPGKRIENDRHHFLDASPLHHVKSRSHTVPFLVIHGTSDIVVPIAESKLLVDHLPKDRTTWFPLKGAHHAFDWFPNPRSFASLDCISEWLHAFEKWHAAAHPRAPRV